ncbi:uncharacterized protein LOC129592554 isoform X2 [Paramacrobiotus metropolitanus]|uniref:uncharacterized protein LOC129592554 isoform X2 n=1 Tax=Paramacrobiotus metropolitanus TaxID=2943436 RepID=UPI002445EB3B|nr:uncharacterized protein LOC129592554 isoform X2 [Paramacrobiotus metropolitanus]
MFFSSCGMCDCCKILLSVLQIGLSLLCFTDTVRCQLALPLGRFGLLSPNLFFTTPTTLAPPGQVDVPAVSRKLADNGSPSDVAFETSCSRFTSSAALKCPCAGTGQRCADALSVCSAAHKCVCDSSRGFADSTGTKCIPYNIPTTAAATAAPVTCPVCPSITCPTTVSATSATCPTTSTSTSVTTSTTTATPTTTTPTATTTTTTAPDTRCATNGYYFNALAGTPSRLCGGCLFATVSAPATITFVQDSALFANCLFNVFGPPGSGKLSVKVTSSTLACTGTIVVINGNRYPCGMITPDPLILDATTAAILIAANNGAGSFVLAISVV